jgi:hypothetical protein
MQTQGVTKEIDGKSYTMFTLPPLESHDLLVEFTKMVVPGAGPVIDAIVGKGLKAAFELETGSEFFTRAAKVIAGSLDNAVLRKLINGFSKVTVVQGTGKLNEIFDVHFAGRLPAMYLWLGWGIEVQWGGLLGALKSSTQLQSAFEELRSKSPTGSTG